MTTEPRSYVFFWMWLMLGAISFACFYGVYKVILPFNAWRSLLAAYLTTQGVVFGIFSYLAFCEHFFPRPTRTYP